MVIETGDYEFASVVGDLLLGMARNKGLVACVTDGLVRDIDGIDKVGMPVFARGLSPNSPFKDGPGEIGLSVVIGGLAIHSGDILVGDKNGVAVVPRERAAEVVREPASGGRQGSADGRVRSRRREGARLAAGGAGCQGRALSRLTIAMPRVLYLSHATPAVYSIIRGELPPGFELVTLAADDDAERRAKVADCEVVIVAATPLRRDVIDAAEGTPVRPSSRRRLPRYGRLHGARRPRHSVGAHAGGHVDRCRRARGAARARRVQAACRTPMPNCEKGAGTSTPCGPSHANCAA